MKARLNHENEWVMYSTLPVVWGKKQPYNASAEGFKNVVYPLISNTQKLGSLYFDQVNDVVTFPVIEMSAEELEENNLELETERYKKRASDGINSYAKMSAEFRLAKISGLMTNESHYALENILRPVRDEVLAGQWITAKSLLLEIGSDAIGDDLFSKVLNLITDYITINY
jgi:hypothetical protein